jgi:hypothetical protein
MHVPSGASGEVVSLKRASRRIRLPENDLEHWKRVPALQPEDAHCTISVEVPDGIEVEDDDEAGVSVVVT